MMTTKKVTWQIRFRNWIGSSTHGLLFCGARRYSSCHGRSVWLEGQDLPDYLSIGLNLAQLPGQAGNWVCPDFHSLEEIKKDALEVKWQRSSYPNEVKGLWTTEEPVERTLMPIEYPEDETGSQGDGKDCACWKVGKNKRGKFYCTVWVDCETSHFTQDIYTDQGPFDTFEEADQWGEKKATIWCLDNNVSFEQTEG